MHRHLALVLLLTAAGCSAAVEDKPSTSRLQAGQVAIVAPMGGGAEITPPQGLSFPIASPASKLPDLYAGNSVRIITDEDKTFGFHRPVRCVVVSSANHPGGDYAGTECLITRGEIRPVAKE